MNELIKHIRGETYYIPSKTNLGIIKKENKIVLIDSGNDKEAGRKLRQSLDAENLSIEYIVNTHSNADHIGANAYLMNQYNCESYSFGREVIFSQYTELESTVLYGGFPTKKMQNKFLKAKPCAMKDIREKKNLDVEYFQLPGHFFDMVGFKTKDNVYFLGDSLFPKDIIDKYHLFYVLDVKGYFTTLDYLEELNKIEGATFVLSHCEITDDISSLIKINRDKLVEVINLLVELCSNNISFDKLLQEIFNHYDLTLDLNQYLLVGSTIRNYLSFLNETEKIDFIFDDNILSYKAK